MIFVTDWDKIAAVFHKLLSTEQLVLALHFKIFHYRGCQNE